MCFFLKRESLLQLVHMIWKLKTTKAQIMATSISFESPINGYFSHKLKTQNYLLSINVQYKKILGKYVVPKENLIIMKP